MTDFKVKIRHVREALRLSRRELGEMLSVTEGKIQKIEMGTQRADHEFLSNISKQTGADINWLLDDEQTAVTGVVPTVDKDMLSLSDLVRLRLAIEAIEESLDAFGRVAAPEVKAGLIVAAYELLEQEGSKATAQIIRLVKAA